jgi:uncharacterized protein YeaO (DUF488 family)
MIQIKRVYEPADRKDGRRILVERLWPRGIKKENLKMDAWAKEAAPSADLRRWFNHDPEKWKEFEKRYRAELAKNPEAWKPLVEAAQSGEVTLLFSAHDMEHNNALVLKNYLEERCKRTAARKSSKARK